MSASILRRAGIGALVVSISAGMTSNLLFLEAFQFRLDRFLEPTLILGSGAIPGRAVALGVSPGPVWLLPRHGGPRVRVVAAAAAAQSTPRGLVDPGRCRLRASGLGGCGRPRHGGADADAGPTRTAGRSRERDAFSLDVGTSLAHIPAAEDVQLECERMHLPEKRIICPRRISSAAWATAKEVENLLASDILVCV